jgi:hypothetical protein
VTDPKSTFDGITAAAGSEDSVIVTEPLTPSVFTHVPVATPGDAMTILYVNDVTHSKSPPVGFVAVSVN